MAFDGSGGDGHDGSSHGAPSLGTVITAVELGAALSGHHVSLADAAAIGMAIDAFGHGHEIPWSPPVGTPAEPAPPTATHLRDGGVPAIFGGLGGDELRLPRVPRDQRAVDVHVWHGWSGVFPSECIRELACRSGLEPHNANATNVHLVTSERAVSRIVVGVPFDRLEDALARPDGWYPGARGTTHLWREFYRIQPRRFWFGTRSSESTSVRTFIAVTGATWHYVDRPGRANYETRVVFSVYSQQVLDVVLNYTYDWHRIARHRHICERLASGLREQLHASDADNV